MIVVLVALSIIACVLLVLVILAQNPKGGGVGSQFGGSGSPIMGVKKTGDILEKLTWGFVIAIMVISITSSLFIATPKEIENTTAGYDIENRGGGQTNDMLQNLTQEEESGAVEGDGDDGLGLEDLEE